MSQEVSVSIEKFGNSLKRASRILSLATELRAAHITSTTKLTSLIYSSNYPPATKDPTYLLRSKPVTLKLKDPLFVGKLEVTLIGKKPLQLSYLDTSGKTHTQYSDNFRSTEVERANKLVFSICTPITELSLYTPDGEVTLRRLQGFVYFETATSSDSPLALSNHLERLHVIQSRASEIDSELNKKIIQIDDKTVILDDKKQALLDLESDLELDIENSKEELGSLESQVELTKSSLDSERTKLSEVSATLNLSREELESLIQSKKSNSEDLQELQSEVRSEKSKLKQLQQDVDVFSEDLKAFTGETRHQQLFYGGVCLILLSVLCFITYSLFDRASGLISLFDNGEIHSVWDLMLSRIPFMLSVIGIVTFIAEGMRRCINQVVVIHEQRLSFLRLSIVAREVVDSAGQDVDLTNEELVKLRTKLKLIMLRQHMEKDLGSKVVNFDDVSPKNVSSIDSSNSDQAA